MIVNRKRSYKSFNESRRQTPSFANRFKFEGYKGDPNDLQELFDAVNTAALAAISKNDATVMVDAGVGTLVVVTDNSKLLKAIDSLCNELVDEDNKVDYVGKQGSVVETKRGCDVVIGKAGDLKISVDAGASVATITKTFKWAKKGMTLPGKLFV